MYGLQRLNFQPETGFQNIFGEACGWGIVKEVHGEQMGLEIQSRLLLDGGHLGLVDNNRF